MAQQRKKKWEKRETGAAAHYDNGREPLGFTRPAQWSKSGLLQRTTITTTTTSMESGPLPPFPSKVQFALSLRHPCTVRRSTSAGLDAATWTLL